MLPTQRTIVANSDRQLRMLIAMTEPGHPGCLLDKLMLVETLPGYLLNEQFVNEVDLPCKRWSRDGVGLGPPPPDEETSSEYELSESEFDSSREESFEDEKIEDDWEAENDSPSSSQDDNDLTLEELRIKYASVIQSSDTNEEWSTRWPAYYSLDSTPIEFSESDKPTEDYGYALATWDRGENTLADLLAHAFNNLRLNTPGKALTELNFQVASRKLEVPERDIKVKEPCVMLGELFHRVAIALHISRLPIHKLALGHGKSVLGGDRLESILNDRWSARKLDLRPSLIHLKELAIKFTPCEGNVLSASFNGGKYAMDENCAPIVELLKFAPNLRSLHLHGYHSWNTAKLGLLEQIVNSRSIVRESLKTVTLEGFGTRLGEVEFFLRRFNTLESLTLKAMYLTTSEFSGISNIIENELESLTYLHLDNFHEIDSKPPNPEIDTYLDGSDTRAKLVYFKGHGESHFPSSGPDRGPNFIIRTGEDARKAVGIRVNVGGSRGLGSLKRYRWVQSWRRDYGGWR